MTSFLRIMRILTAVLFLFCVLLFCWQTIDIYVDGVTKAAANENIFQPDDIRARLKALCAPLGSFGAVACLTIILQLRMPTVAFAGPFRENRVTHSNIATLVKRQNHLRALILCTALLLILLGVMNGGAYDVLVKAINICTECIGLG